MKLTTRTRYALRVLTELATQPRDRAVPLYVLAQDQRVKPKYLEQILLKLEHAHIIKGKKGPGGGYLLAKKPHSITLYHVMKAVNESTAPIGCVDGKPDKYCSHLSNCPMKQHWRKFRKVIEDFCKNLSLEEIRKNNQEVL